MNLRKNFTGLVVVGLVTILATTSAEADDTKKPAAVTASKTAAASATTTKAKPAAVAASTAQPSKRDEIELVHARVNIKDATDDYGIYHKVYDFSDKGTDIIIKSRGQEYELKGMDAAQFLAREGYIVYRDGVGLIAADKLTKHLGIEDSSTSGGGGAAGSRDEGGTSSFMGVNGGPDIKSKTDMVDPGKPELVAEDPGKKGGIFGVTVDGDWEEYNPNDPNTPEGKRKILSDLNDQCLRTAAWGEYWNCIWSCFGEECTAACLRTYEQNKPPVCQEAEALQAQLGDD
jgi:hypothetical protein